MIFGKYQLIERLGQGGMAEVFKAKSYGVEGFQKLLVIKRILPTFTRNSQFVEMFINEAKIAVSLSHANIVQVFDLGKFDNSYYIAMEYVHGLDLATVLKKCARRGRKIPQALAVYLASEVARGLDYAHRRRDDNREPFNIIHRDISPHNILISYEGEVKITDFGIAQARDSVDCGGKAVKGKHAYMAPEQARGNHHTQSVDLFSLGVVLYEVLSGTNPFKQSQKGIVEILDITESKKYPSIGQISRGSVPPALDLIVDKALEPSPQDRFESASEMYASLESFLFNQENPVGARDLAKFIQDLRQTDTDEDVSPPIIAEFDSWGPSSSGPGGSGTTSGQSGDESDSTASTVTSIQVPTSILNGKERDETTASEVSGEQRDVSFLAMEFGGAGAPDEATRAFAEVIMHHGGVVVRKSREVILAAFGLLLADGRDTQDAIDTGLRLQRAAMEEEETCSLQIGIAVHPTRVILQSPTEIREDTSCLSAIGKVRKLARQGRGWVMTSESARQIVTECFRLEDVRIHDIDAPSDTVCRVLGRRPAAETTGRFFGRKPELRAVGQILARVARGESHLITLDGEAGIGKTRVIGEIQKRINRKRYDIGWFRASCVPWKQGTQLSAISTMIRSSLGVRDIIEPEKLRRRVARMRELGLIQAEIEAVETVLGIRAGDGRERDFPNPEEVGRRFRSGLIRALSAFCADKMTLLVWDDFTYVDRESLAILKDLHRVCHNLPLLIILAFRPDSNLKSEFEDSERVTKVDLGPLSKSDSKQLVRARLESRKLDEDSLLEIAFRSGGNPLYIEEYVKTMATAELKQTAGGTIRRGPANSFPSFPKTLRALMIERIGRLPSKERLLLQQASVIGQEFDISILGRLTNLPETSLRRSLLGFFGKGLLSRVSQRVYAFASDLSREVVYSSLDGVERRKTHLAIAHAIETIFESRTGEFIEQLAVHYREGGDRNRAVGYFIKAGKKVAAAYSRDAALDYYLEAFALVENVPEPDEEKLLYLTVEIGELTLSANRLELGLEKTVRGEALARKRNDQKRLALLLRTRAQIEARRGHHRASEYYITSAIQLANQHQDAALQCKLHAAAGQIGDRQGDMNKAAYHYNRAIILSQEPLNSEFAVSVSAALSVALAMSGEIDLAKETVRDARGRAKDVSDPAIRCKVEQASGFVHYMLGENAQSIKSERRALDIAREHGLKEAAAKSTHSLGDVYLSLGDFEQSFLHFRRSHEIATELDHQMLINLNAIFLAYIEAMKFGSEEGVIKLESALNAADPRNSVWERVKMHYFLGKIHFERNQFDEARVHLEQSLRIGQARENHLYKDRASDLLAQIGEQEK